MACVAVLQLTCTLEGGVHGWHVLIWCILLFAVLQDSEEEDEILRKQEV